MIFLALKFRGQKRSCNPIWGKKMVYLILCLGSVNRQKSRWKLEFKQTKNRIYTDEKPTLPNEVWHLKGLKDIINNKHNDL